MHRASHGVWCVGVSAVLRKRPRESRTVAVRRGERRGVDGRMRGGRLSVAGGACTVTTCVTVGDSGTASGE